MKKRFNINLDEPAFTKERTPPKPLFQPSTKGGTETSTSEPVPDQSLSYAQYIVQGKGASADSRTQGPKPPCSGGSGGGIVTAVEQPSVTAHCETVQDFRTAATSENLPHEVSSSSSKETNQDGTVDKQEVCGPIPAQITRLVGSGSSIVVSPRQRGNPILKFVRSVPWEFGDVVPDYVLGQTTCALFLSLRYHNLNPNYIHDRLKQLGNTFTLRVLLVQVDMKDPHHVLKELARICIMADCTLILAWSPEEAGRYLETYKSYEKKPADLLKEQVEKDYQSKVTDCLTTVKSINKTDAITLLSTFSSVDGIISASKEDLVLCPGLGPQKAKRLFDVLHKPFLKSKTNDS
ncbi:DNA excision repair protein ERCC-1 [Gouania willdenowi]|uniref:DNA excision repair protein ERCC-1 n=1 Tax=Gouania willdenowi TaxID=441366 RepID=A0A8C5E7F4_GOUWI|nr:DNA excision repair protein ERCC-1 [Gouania willdenowi]